MTERQHLYAPVTLEADEQVVHAVEGRILPTLSDAFWIVAFQPVWWLLPMLVFHRAWRTVTYMVTTRRVLVIEPAGIVDQIALNDIVRFRGNRVSLMLIGTRRRVWLSRLPDAVFLENLIRNVTARMRGR